MNISVQLTPQVTFYGQGSCNQWGNRAQISYTLNSPQGPIYGQGTVFINGNTVVMQVNQNNGLTLNAWHNY